MYYFCLYKFPVGKTFLQKAGGGGGGGGGGGSHQIFEINLFECIQ